MDAWFIIVKHLKTASETIVKHLPCKTEAFRRDIKQQTRSGSGFEET
jgi:hypothetical protein